MPARKQWDEEDSDDSTPPTSPAAAGAAAARRKFDDEEEDDVLDSWDAEDDSEAEREKEKKAAEAKAKAAAAAAAAKKPKAQRVAEHQTERLRKKAEVDLSAEDLETEAERRERLRRAQVEADLDHAADMFGDIGVNPGRSKARPAAVAVDSKDPHNTVDISKLPLFNPTTKAQFDNLRTILAPILVAHAKKPHYSMFLQDFSKSLAREMPSDQIKKLASSLTALGNEKMQEEKAAQKGGKKTKAAKTKTSLVTGTRNMAEDVGSYDQDDFGDDDFM